VINNAATGQGVWQYNDDGSWIDIGTDMTVSTAFVLSSETLVRFLPELNWNGVAGSLDVHLIDNSSGSVVSGTAEDLTEVGGVTQYSSGMVSLDTIVNPINDAPLVNSNSTNLSAIDEDNLIPPGSTVNTLFGENFDDSTDEVSGGSSANSLAGIAVVINNAATGQGVWQYNDDGSWIDIGTDMTVSTAFVLSSETLVRFLPELNWNGVAGSLDVHLIDDDIDSINNGDIVDMGAGNVGDTTSYSVGIVTLNIAVLPINDQVVILAINPTDTLIYNNVELDDQVYLYYEIYDIDSDQLTLTWKDTVTDTIVEQIIISHLPNISSNEVLVPVHSGENIYSLTVEDNGESNDDGYSDDNIKTDMFSETYNINVMTPTISIQNSQSLIRSPQPRKLTALTVSNGIVDNTINDVNDVYLTIPEDLEYEWDISGVVNYNSLLIDNVTILIESSNILKLTIRGNWGTSDSSTITGLQIQPVEGSSDILGNYSLRLNAMGLESLSYDNAKTQNEVIIGNPTVTNGAEYMVINDLVDENTIWNSDNITIHNGSIGGFFRPGHKLYLNIADGSVFKWYTPNIFIINSTKISLYDFNDSTLIFDIISQFEVDEFFTIENVKFEIENSSSPDYLVFDVQTEFIDNPDLVYPVISYNIFSAGNPTFYSEADQLFTVGDNTQTLADIYLVEDSISPVLVDRAIHINIPDIIDINWSDALITENIWLFMNADSSHPTNIIIDDKSLKIEPPINFDLNAADILRISGLQVSGFDEKSADWWNLSYSVLNPNDDNFENYSSVYHDADTNQIAVAQPKVELETDQYMVVGDIAKPIGAITIFQDPNFIAIKDIFTIALPEILGGFWELDSTIEYLSDTYTGSILESSIDNNLITLTLSVPPDPGTYFSITNLKVGGLTNTFYENSDNPANFIRISLNNGDTYSFPHLVGEIDQLKNIFVGQPQINSMQIHSFILDESERDLGDLTITDDAIIQSINENDIIRIVLPDEFNGEWCESSFTISPPEYSGQIDSNNPKVIIIEGPDSEDDYWNSLEQRILIISGLQLCDMVYLSEESHIILSFNDSLTSTHEDSNILRIGNPQIVLDENYAYMKGDLSQTITIEVTESFIAAGIDKDDDIRISIPSTFHGNISSSGTIEIDQNSSASSKVDSAFTFIDNILKIIVTDNFSSNDILRFNLDINSFDDISDSTYLSLSANGGSLISSDTENSIRIGDPSFSSIYNQIFIKDSDNTYIDYMEDINISENDFVSCILSSDSILIVLPSDLPIEWAIQSIIDDNSIIIPNSGNGTIHRINSKTIQIIITEDMDPGDMITIQNLPVLGIYQIGSSNIKLYPKGKENHKNIDDPQSLSIANPEFVVDPGISYYLFLPNDVTRTIENINIQEDDSFPGITQRNGIYIGINENLEFNFDTSHNSTEISINGEIETIDINYFQNDLKLVHLPIPRDLNAGDDLIINTLWFTSFQATDSLYQPLQISAKRDDRFSVNILDNSAKVAISGANLFTTNLGSIPPSERSILINPITITENNNPLIPVVLHRDHIENICLMLPNGISWDLNIPVNISPQELIIIDNDNLDSSKYCFDLINEYIDPGESLEISNMRVYVNNYVHTSNDIYLSLNNTSYQDTVSGWMGILDYSLSSESDQTFLKNVNDSLHYKLKPITVTQSPPFQYNPSYGLIFRIPLNLDAIWDESMLDSIDVYPTNIVIDDYSLSDNNKDLTLYFNNFESNAVGISGLYFDKDNLSPSEGKIKIIYDGNNNNIVLPDDKNKVIADLGISLESDAIFIQGDTGEFAKLPPIIITEDKNTPIFSNSEISICLPSGISWDTSRIPLFCDSSQIENISFENDSCMIIESLDIALEQSLAICGLYLEVLDTPVTSSLNYTISYSTINQDLNPPAVHGVYVVNPKIITNNYNLPVALGSTLNIDIIQLIEDEIPVFNENRNLILYMEGDISNYLQFSGSTSIVNENIDSVSTTSESIEISFSNSLNPREIILLDGITLEYIDGDQLFNNSTGWEIFNEGLHGNISFAYRLQNTGEFRTEKITSDSSGLTIFTPSILTEPVIHSNLDILKVQFKSPGIDPEIYNSGSFMMKIGDDTLHNVILNIFGIEPGTEYYSGLTFSINQIELFFDNSGEYFDLGLAEINSKLQKLGDNSISDLKIFGDRNVIYNTENIYFNNDYQIVHIGYDYDFDIMADPLLNSSNLTNSLITLGGEFEGENYIRISSENLSIDTLITIGNNSTIEFNTIIDEYELNSGVYYLFINHADSLNILPLIKQFTVDNDAPFIFSDNSYKGIGKDGFGHLNHAADSIIFSIQDNFVVDSTEIIYVTGSPYEQFYYQKYSEIIDSIEVSFYLHWGDGEFENSDTVSQMVKPLPLGFETMNYFDIIDSMYTNMISSNSVQLSSVNDLGYDYLMSMLEINLKDHAGNISVDTFNITLTFETEKLLAASAFNFPNPFSNIGGGRTQIRYLLNKQVDSGKLIILDAGGNVIYNKVLDDQNLSIGTHYLIWNGKNNNGYSLASGVYLAYLEFNDIISEKIKIAILNR